MSEPIEPPQRIVLRLDEALDLLAALEDARDSAVADEHLSGVVTLEAQIRILSRKLGFDDGGADHGR